jgi:chromosome segregation and condensation protein ScpB
MRPPRPPWRGAPEPGVSDVDKRHVVNVLRESGMVEEFVGAGGRLQFVTTGKFLERFEMESLEELRRVFQANR